MASIFGQMFKWCFTLHQTGTDEIVNVDFATTLRAKPDITLNILGQSDSSDRQSEESDNSADIPNPSTSNDHLYFRTFFKVSPNSQKIAILQTAYEKGTLTVMDVHSQQKTSLSVNMSAPPLIEPFNINSIPFKGMDVQKKQPDSDSLLTLRSGYDLNPKSTRKSTKLCRLPYG